MNTILKSDIFDEWLTKLKDLGAKANIALRIERAELGNFGDHKSVGGNVLEMRIHKGPGYRVYYTQRGDTLYLLLVGGDKSNQQRDIKKAMQMAAELPDEDDTNG